MSNDEMKKVILNQHEQITKSLEANKDVRIEGEFDSMILAGMGGSGHPGDLINALGLPTTPLYVHRNYDLPLSYLNHLGLTKPLFVASSYSGNTEEPLTGYQAAQKQNIPIIASASGGTLCEWAQRDGVPFSRIVFTDMQPRHTLFAAFTGIYTSLKNSGLAEDITSDLTRTADVLKKVTPDLAKPAQDLAKKIKGKIPVYYSTDNIGFATKNFKIQTNENAKYPAFWNVFPELNHNELVGFSKLKEMENPNKFLVLMIRDDDDHPRNRARMDATTKLYQYWGAQVEEFQVNGDTLLEKIFYTVTFGLWTTYHLALECNVDPVPVEGVEDFKVKLKEIAGEI